MPFLRLWVPPIAWAVLILAASSDQFSMHESGGWLRRIAGREVAPWLHFLIRKAAHVVEYGVLAALVFRAAAESWSARTATVAAAALLAVALVATADELRQSRTRSRRGAADDVALDLGSGAAVVGALAWRKRRGRGTSPPARSG